MKFSIIIPVYNVEQYLTKCLDSVVNQTYNDEYEVICVNDGSTDSSLAILEEYAKISPKVVVINSPNGGTASARNLGLNVARGEYIWFIDSDDWIEENSLEFLAEYLNKSNPDVFCFNGKLLYEEDGREEHDEGVADDNLTGWGYYNKYALQRRKFHFVCVVLRLYRREFLLNNNLFFEVGILHEDNLWVPQICYYAQTVKIIPNMLYVYHIRQGSKMRTVTQKQIEDIITVANRLAEFFIPKTDIDKSVVYREIAGEYLVLFVEAKSVTDLRKKYSFLKPKINWSSFRTIVDNGKKRHKRLSILLRKSRFLFYYYIKFESVFKNMIYK